MTRTALAAGAAGPDAARPDRARTLAWVPALTLGLFLGPIAVGLVGTLLPAFGLLPALGGTHPSLQPWRDLAAAPGFTTALRLSAASGFASTLVALGAALSVAACWHGARWFRTLRGLLAPMLAIPHAAFAIGFAFLVAPSGWIVRLASPWATGWERPPDLPLVNDPWGVALTLALVAKEFPFLLMMVIAALGQVRADQALTSARCMGYGPVAAWTKTVLPLVWPQIRLPVYAVLAFSLSVVDMALVLGPGTPPTLAVLILRWFNDPDLSLRFQAAAAACVQVALVAAAIGLFRSGELAAARLLRGWAVSGRRGGPASGARAAALAALAALATATGGALAALLAWSVAARWRFPDALPSSWGLDRWAAALPGLAGPIMNTVAAAALSTALALALVLGCLEHERRSGRGRPTSRALWLLYAPLLVPQIGFLFGVQVLLVLVGLDGTWPALAWSHLLFVLPYVFLALADPYRALDERYARSARCLGASPGRVFRTITLPLLARPIAVAAAVGMSVSVAQYLPTVFAGAGRLPTVTTEAVALAGGGDRRALAVVAVVQMLLPLLGFAAALMAGRRR